MAGSRLHLRLTVHCRLALHGRLPLRRHWLPLWRHGPARRLGSILSSHGRLLRVRLLRSLRPWPESIVILLWLILLRHLAVGRGNVRVRWALHLGRLRSLRTGTVLCRHSLSFCDGGISAHLSLESQPAVNGPAVYPSSNTSADCHVLQTTSPAPLNHFRLWMDAVSSTLCRRGNQTAVRPPLHPRPSPDGRHRPPHAPDAAVPPRGHSPPCSDQHLPHSHVRTCGRSKQYPQPLNQP